MKWSIISPAEKALLKKIEGSNDTDVSVWKISNIIIPIATIIVSIGCSLLFKRSGLQVMTWLNLLLTGAIPMIALNRISNMGIYLFKYDRSKEKSYGIGDTYILRTKIAVGIVFLLLVTMILYVHQVLNYPFKADWIIAIILPASIASVYYALYFSKRVYLLQDRLIEKTFDQEMTEEIKGKGHGQNWKKP